MKLSFLKYMTVCLAAIFTVSCGDSFLTVTPKDVLTDANFFVTESDAQSALIGAYAGLQSEATYGGVVPSANLDWTMSGDLYEQDQNTPRVQLEMFDLPATNTYISQMYQGLYQGVGRANFVIDGVNKMQNLDANVRSLVIAQAKFLRAIYYYRLVNYFGGVPLVLEELNAASKLDIPRSSADDCWKQIESDLNDAAAALPVTWTNSSDIGRATKGAALGFLVKTYLWQAKWADAVSASEKIIDLNVYGLLPNFRNVFLESNENNKEIVFSTQFSSVNNGIEGTNLDVRSEPRGFPSEFVGRDAWSNFVPQISWINAFERDASGKIKDGRYWGAIIGPGEHHQDMPDFILPATVPNQGTKTGYIVSKYWQKASPVAAGVNFPVLRYAEVLLNYAEALNEVGRSEDAMKQVNLIRKRAGLDPKPLNLSKDQVLDAVFYEARMGFIWEPYGAFSMLNQRGRVIDFIKKNRVDFSKIGVAGKPWLQTNPILLPIPLDAWNVNKSLVQNPGYPPFK